MLISYLAHFSGSTDPGMTYLNEEALPMIRYWTNELKQAPPPTKCLTYHCETLWGL